MKVGARRIKNITSVSDDWQINLGLILLTTAIGTAVVLSGTVTVYLWAALIIYTFFAFLTGRVYQIWYCIAISPQLEILTRMTQTKKAPDEMGKYYLFLVIALFYIGMLDKRNKYLSPKYRVGSLLLAFIIPSLIYAAIYTPFDIKYWVFNVSGVIQIGILLLFAARERWTEFEFFKIVKCSTILTIPIIEYLTVKTPKFSEIDFGNAANFSTTGNFGPNQVSTAIGATLFIIALLMVLNKNVFRFLLLNIALVGALIFRGLITFSRGGMVVCFLAILVSIALYAIKDKKTFFRYTTLGFASIVVLVFSFYIVNKLTNDALYVRYTGKRTGEETYSNGTSLNKLTANRELIAHTDIGIFLDNIIFGVGPGQARFYRQRYGGFNIIAHLEYTRLLSEHGIGGFFECIVLTIFPIVWVRKIKSQKVKSVCAGMFILAVGNSFHAAARTNNFAVYYVLAALPVISTVKPKSRSVNNTDLTEETTESTPGASVALV